MAIAISPTWVCVESPNVAILIALFVSSVNVDLSMAITAKSEELSAPFTTASAVLSSANVIMPNLSPVKVRDKYTLYDNKLISGAESAEKIDELKEQIGIKKTIKDYGIEEKDFLDRLDEMTEQAFDDQCTGANPRYPLMSEIKDMYLRAYYGGKK